MHSSSMHVPGPVPVSLRFQYCLSGSDMCIMVVAAGPGMRRLCGGRASRAGVNGRSMFDVTVTIGVRRQTSGWCIWPTSEQADE